MPTDDESAPRRTPSTLDDPRVARAIDALLAFFQAIDHYCRPDCDGRMPLSGAIRYVEEAMARATIELLEALEALEAAPYRIGDAADRLAIKKLEGMAKEWIESWGWGDWAFRSDRRAYVQGRLDLFDAEVIRPLMQAALDCEESDDFDVLQEVRSFAKDAREWKYVPTGMDPGEAKAIF